MAKANNRRSRTRVPLAKKVKHSQYHAAGIPVFQESSTIDVSSRGLSFTTERSYKKGDLIFLEIHMDEGPVRFLVCVAWIKKSKGEFHVGAELMGIDPAHQRKMQRALEKLNRQRDAGRAASPRKTKVRRKK